MNILLLIPPTNLETSYGDLKSFSNPQPSIGLAYIAAVLRDHGFNLKIVDAYVNNYGLKELLELIADYQPEIIGISVLTPSAEVVYGISRAIHARWQNIKIVMGNMHASLFAEEILNNNFADYIVHGEGELTFLNLVRSIETGIGASDVCGISFRKDGQVVHNGSAQPIDDLDGLPLPAWDLFPMDKYSTDPRTEVKKCQVEMQILATRGCPNQCTFCSSRTERSLGTKYRMRTPKLVVDEMEYLYDQYGSRVFSFMDLAFPLVRNHAIELCDEIIARGLHNKISWVTECRVKPLDQELLYKLKKAGCVRINFGIESGNDHILQELKKNFTVEDVRQAVTMASKAGIEADGMFMIGLPNETEETIKMTIKFAISLNLRYAIFNLFVPYPGCELFDQLSMQNKIHYGSWSDFTSYPTYSGGRPVYVPDGLTHEQLMKLQQYAMKHFYLRPRFIIQELRRFKFSQLTKYTDGLKALFSK